MEHYNKLDHPEILQFIFHARQDTELSKPTGCKDFNINIDSNTVLGGRLFLHDHKSPTILYFHGNGETIADYNAIAPLYCEAGLNFLIVTYRGYGWSGGTPTVKAMIDDCTPILENCEQICLENNMTGPLFVMGRSIGSVSAIELAHNFPDTFKGLIIESGFADTLPLLSNLGLDPVEHGLEEKDGFGNRDKIASITMPTLILHGSLDAIIPIPQAERLQAFSGARTKKFFVIPGADHNSVLSVGGEHYFSTIKGFIDELTGKTSWRRQRKKFKKHQNDE